MKFQELRDDSERVAFISRFRECSGGVEYELEYLKPSSAVVGFDESGRMICGYMLIPGHAMRWPSLVPVTTEFQKRFPPEQMLELNGVWLEPGFRGRAEAAELWLQIAKDVSRQSRRYITYGVDPRKEGLVRLYRKVSSGIIYEGPIRNNPAVPAARVYWSARWRFQLLRLLYAWDLRRRFLAKA